MTDKKPQRVSSTRYSMPREQPALPLIHYDEFLPDAQVRRELGGQSDMTTARWDKSEEMRALGWPPPIVIRGRKFRSRNAIEAFKQALVRQGPRDDAGRG
jgi:hypothetical protein